MDVITLKTLILAIGWPVLLIGSAYLVVILFKSHNKYKLEVTRIILIMVVGWLFTMYSLGVVSTFYLLSEATNATQIVSIVFAVWLLTMIIITNLSLTARKKILQNIEAEVRNKTKNLVRSQKFLEQEIEKRTFALKKKAEELQMTNDAMVGRELKMVELKKENTRLKKILEQNNLNIPNVQNHPEA